jgi:drug/metabolite transporter (DMT)-like permease
MKTKIWIALLALYIVWGSTYLAIRFAVETIPPFFSAGVRFFISGIILLIWRRASGDSLPTRTQWMNTAVIGLLLLLGGNGLVSWAEQTIPSGIAALIIGSVPLFLVVTEALRPGGVKPNWQVILSLLIGFAGIYILVDPSDISGSGMQLDPLGVGALLIACLLWAIGSVYSKSADLPKSSLMTTGAEMFTGSIGLFIVSGLTNEWAGYNLTAVSMDSILALLYLIFIGSLIGFVSYGWLLQNAPISLVATYAYVNPVVAVLLGNWLAAEPLESRTWLAAAIITGSVALINSTKKPASGTRVIKERVSESSSD